MLASAFCLLVSLSVLVSGSVISRHKDIHREFSALGDILAENSQAAIMFSDKAEARRLLESLHSHQNISRAWIVNGDGELLASWSKQGEAGAIPPDYRVQSRQLRSNFKARSADLYLPVAKKSERIGYVLLRADFTGQWSNLLSILEKGLAGATLAMLLTLPFAWFFATTISRPMSTLSRISRGIAGDRQSAELDEELHHLGKKTNSRDELGDLIQSFITMHEAVNNKIQQINELNVSLEQKIRERTVALAASERECRTLIENTPDTIARYDSECRRIYANPAFGALAVGGVANLLGKKPSENPGGANSLIYEAKISEVFATGNNTQFELKWCGKDGREICSHIRLTAEYDPSGNIVSVLGVGRDITELNEYRAELQRKEQAKSRFLASAGHDLRQPLAAANLFIGALKFTESTPEQARIIQHLDQAMTTFNGLLDSLLNISKLDSGVVVPEYTSIDVIEIFSWLEQNFEPVISEKKLGFKLHFPMREMLVIHSDINLVKSVLANLVGNAIKYTLNGGILVSARRRGNNVLFQVWDTGIGINMDHMGKIFDEFYQINNPQRDRRGGLGLGLAIAKRAITILDSRITLRSKVGRGSVFEFLLPLDSALKKTKSVSDENLHDSAANSSYVQGRHFVVLEDDMLVAEALKISLECMGAKVSCFYSAEDALSHVNELQGSDCYLVDHMLGGTFNGIQFLNILSKRFDKPINAVLLTGDTSTEFIRDTVDFAWPVLHKPVNITKLISTFQR